MGGLIIRDGTNQEEKSQRAMMWAAPIMLSKTSSEATSTAKVLLGHHQNRTAMGTVNRTSPNTIPPKQELRPMQTMLEDQLSQRPPQRCYVTKGRRRQAGTYVFVIKGKDM
jgi:hypothetical protein